MVRLLVMYAIWIATLASAAAQQAPGMHGGGGAAAGTAPASSSAPAQPTVIYVTPPPAVEKPDRGAMVPGVKYAPGIGEKGPGRFSGYLYLPGASETCSFLQNENAVLRKTIELLELKISLMEKKIAQLQGEKQRAAEAKP